MENNEGSFFEKVNTSISNSVSIKLLIVGALIGILLIPASMISSVIRERRHNSESVKAEIAGKWGNPQQMVGPVITIPYKKISTHENKMYTTIHYAHFLPDNLKVSGALKPVKRKRGIYEVALYNTDLEVSGNFSKLDFSSWSIPEEHVLWSEAFISVGIDDMRGIQQDIVIKTDEGKLRLNPGIPVNEILRSGVSHKLAIPESKSLQFAFDVNMNGSQSLQFCPIGKNTNVSLTSEWKDPKFSGQFLPDSRDISKSGFAAHWKVLDLNRNFPQKWLGKKHHITSTTFGVDLFLPVDHYQKNTRSAKYGGLILLLSFLTFFFVEILNKKKIHPIQYILVGLAISVFYLLLLSLTEHVGFNLAYLISASIIISMISLYTSAILKNRKLTLYMFFFFTMIYTFIFIILQLQDYALLVGSAGLAIVLASCMYLSRKVDWYNISRKNTLEKV